MSKEILISELPETLIVEEEGKTVLEIFQNALGNKDMTEETLSLFTPIISKKRVNWDYIPKLNEELRVIPNIAGGQ